MAEILYSDYPKAIGSHIYLPIIITYYPDNDGPVILQLTGSAFSNVVNKKIGLQLVINGENIVEASGFSTLKSRHIAMNPGVASYTFPYVIEEVEGPTPENPIPKEQTPQRVTIEIHKLNDDTQVDYNDHIALVIL